MQQHTSTANNTAFFAYYAWTLFILVVLCFGGKALIDPEGLPVIIPLHHFHAVAMLSWVVLFALQATFMHQGHRDWHRLLGRLSPLLVVTFVTFAVAISLLNWEKTGGALIITVNALNLLLFLIYYTTGIVCRKRTAAHMRWMLYATLILMGPAIGRLPEIFGWSPFMAVPGLLLLQLIPLIHDKWVHGRIHPVCWVGFLVFLITVPLIVSLSESAGWYRFLTSLLGDPGAGVVP